MGDEDDTLRGTNKELLTPASLLFFSPPMSPPYQDTISPGSPMSPNMQETEEHNFAHYVVQPISSGNLHLHQNNNNTIETIPIFNIPSHNVYHSIRPPVHNSQRSVKPATTPSSTPPISTPPPNTPLHPFGGNHPKRGSSASNPIIPQREALVRSTSVDEIQEIMDVPQLPFGSTANTKDSTCFVCKEKLTDKTQVTHRNIVLAINLEGIDIVKPFVETILVHYPWRAIKQWSWNQFSFLFLIQSVSNELTVYFETLQSDEILKAINYYVSVNVKRLKELQEQQKQRGHIRPL